MSCLVGEKGLEPSRLATRVPKTRVSAIPPLARDKPPLNDLHPVGVSFRGRSKEFCLQTVAGSSRQQHDQGEYGGQHYQVDANHMPPRLPMRITASIITAAIHNLVFIMLLVSCRSALPSAGICPDSSSKDPLSSAPSSAISLSTCACYRI